MDVVAEGLVCQGAHTGTMEKDMVRKDKYLQWVVLENISGKHFVMAVWHDMGTTA